MFLKKLMAKRILGLEVGTVIYLTIFLGSAVYGLRILDEVDWYVIIQ